MATPEERVRKAQQDAIYFAEPLSLAPSGVAPADLDPAPILNQLLLEAVGRVPDNGQWRCIALMFSKGHASASSSHINQGRYGERIQACYEPAENGAYPDAHHLFIRKGRRLS